MKDTGRLSQFTITFDLSAINACLLILIWLQLNALNIPLAAFAIQEFICIITERAVRLIASVLSEHSPNLRSARPLSTFVGRRVSKLSIIPTANRHRVLLKKQSPREYRIWSYTLLVLALELRQAVTFGESTELMGNSKFLNLGYAVCHAFIPFPKDSVPCQY